MVSGNAIEINDLVKSYSIKKTTKFGGISKSGSKIVLDHVSLCIKKGEIVGVIGRNGSGKSTLLKLMAGIIEADSGQITVNGKIAGVLELGMGFQYELSGRENIYIKFSLYGFKKNQIDPYLDKIIAFSELGNQIDDPLRTYSSGMVAKLAFAILTHINCDILVMDEALSVGDISFNSKCSATFNKLKKWGKSVVITSHNLNILEKMCDRVIWIDDGKIKEIGDSSVVCYHFKNDSLNSYSTLLNLAESGDVVSLNRLGLMCRDGIRTPKNLDNAEKWFKKASDFGHSEAEFNLAELLNAKGDITQSKMYYARAAEHGNLNANIRLNELDGNYNSELEILLDDIASLSESGNLRATRLYADILYKGQLIPKDLVTAFNLYLKCAKSGDVSSQFIVGLCYRDGIGVEVDAVSADYWLSLSSDNGNIMARAELIKTYRKGIGVEPDIEKVIEYYEQGARKGDLNSMLQLSNMYRDGIGIEVDLEKSTRWMKCYVSGLRSSVENTLADIYKQGYLGDEKSKCISWYDVACVHGSPSAAFSLAVCYRDGIGVEPDSALALDYFKKASNLGNTWAMIEVSNMFLKGNGCVKNSNEAFNYMKKASDCGNISAILHLAKMYERGIGHAVDLEKASILYKKSIEFGNMEARNLILMLK